MVGVSLWPYFQPEICRHQLSSRSQTKTQEKIWTLSRKYFQSNIETRKTDIIKKRRTGFTLTKTLMQQLFFCGIILYVV